VVRYEIARHVGLVRVWKGAGDDARMFSSSSGDGQNWTGEAQVGGLTSHGPALAAFGGRLVRVWKGAGDDARMFSSSSGDGQNWTGEIETGGLTSDGPAVASPD
jgi:hypothetical protein